MLTLFTDTLYLGEYVEMNPIPNITMYLLNKSKARHWHLWNTKEGGSCDNVNPDGTFTRPRTDKNRHG